MTSPVEKGSVFGFGFWILDLGSWRGVKCNSEVGRESGRIRMVMRR